MRASEPILFLVTIYLSAVYGVLYGRAYLSLAVSINRLPSSFRLRSCMPLYSLRSLPDHLHRTPQPFHLPKRPDLRQPRDRCLPRRPPQPATPQSLPLLHGALPRFPTAGETTVWCHDCGPEFGGWKFMVGVVRAVRERAVVCSRIEWGVDWGGSHFDFRFIFGAFSLSLSQPVNKLTNPCYACTLFLRVTSSRHT